MKECYNVGLTKKEVGKFLVYLAANNIPFSATECLDDDIVHVEADVNIVQKAQCNKVVNMLLGESGKNKRTAKIPASTLSIKNVIFNNPATIVLWDDGSKTVVKAQNHEVFDPEKGLAMAISKKAFGNKGSYFNEIKKWTDTPQPDDIDTYYKYRADASKKINDAISGAISGVI